MDSITYAGTASDREDVGVVRARFYLRNTSFTIVTLLVEPCALDLQLFPSPWRDAAPRFSHRTVVPCTEAPRRVVLAPGEMTSLERRLEYAQIAGRIPAGVYTVVLDFSTARVGLSVGDVEVR